MARFLMKILKPEQIGGFKPYEGTEDQFQIAVAQYLDLKGLLWTHPANERKTKTYTSKKGVTFSLEGIFLTKKGVKKGVPDCLIFEPRKGFAGFFIELKCGKNKPTDHQILFLENAKKRGYKTLITWSLDEFIFEIDKYLS
jgi:hypothetical protein